LFGLTAPARFAGAFFCGCTDGWRRLGSIAANAICDDLALQRSWTPLPPPEWKY
jgi:hypothetical protein